MANDPYRYFRVEAGEILQAIGRGLLELEKGEAEKEVVARLLRLAHTLKGAARVVRQKEIADLAHRIEDCLQPLREGSAEVSRELVDRLLALADAMGTHVNALNESVAAKETSLHRAREEPLHAPRVDPSEMDTLIESVAELSSELDGIRRAAVSLEAARRTGEALHQRALPRSGDARPAATRLGGVTGELLELLGAASGELNRSIERLERELRQVGEAAERLRLVPASAMFGVLERAARDAGVSLGKRVELDTRGGDVRLDPDALSAIQGALVQGVRNACAHGIESPGEREAAGKPVAGRITIEISRHGSRVRFACRDDGRGIDYDAIRRVRARKGRSEELDDRRLTELLMKGGFSTSREVTEVSGRGVGLDVVRESAARLGGTAAISSEPGRGTLLEIVVPLSRSALDALLVENDGRIVAIPLDAIRGALRVSPADVARNAEGDSLLIEGNVVPFTPLERSLTPRRMTRSAGRLRSAVLLESGGVRTAVGVDRLLGAETVVVRPLPEAMPHPATVSGTSLDAEGNPRLVLDPEGLVASARNLAVERWEPTTKPEPILIIDDSLTTRMLEQSILESAGFDVETAVSGEEALEKARAKRYSLFLVDVEMPGIDGFTFVERTRADASLREIPAILVSSRASADDRRRGEAAGAKGYIAKGEFDQNELLSRIRSLVS